MRYPIQQSLTRKLPENQSPGGICPYRGCGRPSVFAGACAAHARPPVTAVSSQVAKKPGTVPPWVSRVVEPLIRQILIDDNRRLRRAQEAECIASPFPALTGTDILNVLHPGWPDRGGHLGAA
jgi:hypothetical protein